MPPPPNLETRPLAVFGYGSLMWRPDFPFVRHRPAVALRLRRHLCVWSATYRGSVARPGLVFGLDHAVAATTPGVLFDVAPSDRRAVLAYLFQRELIYPIYQPEIISVKADGVVIEALAFVVDRADPAYAGDLSNEARVAAIRTGVGRAGRARDYLFKALEGLDAMGVGDPQLNAALATADGLPDDPGLIFRLLDEGARRRLDAVFQLGHEAPAV
jgi:cation transport protein ChaC